jgi:hypothetical protein
MPLHFEFFEVIVLPGLLPPVVQLLTLGLVTSLLKVVAVVVVADVVAVVVFPPTLRPAPAKVIVPDAAQLMGVGGSGLTAAPATPLPIAPAASAEAGIATAAAITSILRIILIAPC